MQTNPYAPPRSPILASSPANLGAYRPARITGQLVIATSGFILGCDWLLIPLSLSSGSGLALAMKIGRILTIPAVLAMIVFFVWLYRAAANLRALGRRTWSPAICVLWFFVPIANVVMPGAVVGRIETASRNESGMPLAHAWWLAYMLSMITGGAVNTLTREGAVGVANGLRVFGNVVITACFVMLVVVVRRISDGQTSLYTAARSQERLLAEADTA